MVCGKSVESTYLPIQASGSLRGVSAPGRYILRFYRGLRKHLTHPLHVRSLNSAKFPPPFCLIITVNGSFHNGELLLFHKFVRQFWRILSYVCAGYTIKLKLH